MSLYGIIRDPKTDIDVLRANERINNMSEQQFEDLMNELFLRDYYYVPSTKKISTFVINIARICGIFNCMNVHANERVKRYATN